MELKDKAEKTVNQVKSDISDKLAKAKAAVEKTVAKEDDHKEIGAVGTIDEDDIFKDDEPKKQVKKPAETEEEEVEEKKPVETEEEDREVVNKLEAASKPKPKKQNEAPKKIGKIAENEAVKGLGKLAERQKERAEERADQRQEQLARISNI